MKYFLILFTALLVSACSESPEEAPAAGSAADASHAHDGDAHSHEGGEDHAHDSSETEVFYGDQAESANEVGTAGGPSATGVDHEHDDSADHHHEQMNSGDDSHSEEDAHQHESADHHHEDGAEDHHH